jgi:hypothetical protein
MDTPEDTGSTPVETGTEPPQQPLEPSPFPKRIVEVFFSPGRLVEALARHPLWAAALALGAVIAIVQVLVIPAHVWDAMIREQMMARGQDASAFPGSTSLVRIFALVGGTFVYFVMALLTAGIVTVVFAFVLGDEGRFKQYFAILTHALLIPAIVGLALVPLKIAQSDLRLTLNVGTFLFFLPEGYLLKWATMMDLSMLWAWLVVAQGARAVDPKRSFGSAAGVTIGIFVVISALLALLPGTG